MSDYSEFFLNSKSSIVQLELLEISHPNFTKTYRVVRNAVDGVTVTLEDSSTETFDYYPLSITSASSVEDLDYSIKIALGDLGEVLPLELDAISTAGGYDVKPTVKYRTYSSDDLSKPLFGPILLEVKNFTFNREGSVFEAEAPLLNINRTGEIYTINRFPMLKGLL